MAEEETYEEEPVSDEEKLQIAQHYLLNAPPGQFTAVLEDVKALLPPGLLGDAVLQGIAREFNVRNLRILASGDTKVLISKESEVDASHYVHPRSGLIIPVNHVTMAAPDGEEPRPMDGPMNAAVEAQRQAMDESVAEYVEGRYLGEAASGVYAKAGSDSELRVLISGEKLNLRNMWSGQFISSWTVTLNAAGASISGEIKVRAHYFEGGNVQLQTKKPVPEVSLSAADPASLAKAVSEHISAEEKIIQEGYEEMYTNMTGETFKAMRRVMPIHKNKVSWNINEVRLNSNLRK